MNILILAAGHDPLAQQEGYPLCLAEFDSIPLIQRVIASCGALSPNKLIVAFREAEARRHHLSDVVSLLWPGVQVIMVPENTQGAACTALLAAGAIDADEELLIVNGNEVLDVDFARIPEDFRCRNLDGGVVVFHSIHPRYSYVRLGDDALVVEAAEKRPISTNATAGFYWFASGKEFVRAAKSLIRKDARVNGSFYICPAFNEMILCGLRIGVYTVDNKNYHPLKTGRQIEQFETAIERGRVL